MSVRSPAPRTLSTWQTLPDLGYPPPFEAWAAAPKIEAQDPADAAYQAARQVTEARWSVWVRQIEGPFAYSLPERVFVERWAPPQVTL